MIQQLSVLAVLGICSYEDIKHKKIYLKWFLIFAVEAMILRLLQETFSMAEIIIAVLPGLFVLILAFAVKGSIGAGDGMLLMNVGMFLGGERALEIFVYALFISAGYALFLFAIRKKGRKYEIAFVPFLLLAFLAETFMCKM